MATTTFWRKRSVDSDDIDPKRAKLFNYIIRLESESPSDSDDDTESVYSVQEKTTDTVKDTTDTDARSSDEFEVEIEYEVASLSTASDQETYIDSSSEPEDFMLAAAAICDSSLETFITDAEDSDNSLQENDSSAHALLDFWTCIQCNAQNDNPQYRYCDKCFQMCRECKIRKTYKCFLLCNECYKDRKTSFPVRPRRFKKARRSKPTSPVKLDALKSCLSNLSQDSGLGSSQEFPSLCLDQIVVPDHLDQKPSTSQKEITSPSQRRKRQISESSLSEYEVPTKKAKLNNNVTHEESKISSSSSSSSVEKTNSVRIESTVQESSLPEYKELCITCHSTPKNSIFLHGRIAHMCCCYKCAMRTWRQSKRCPICNRRVNNVVRVFTI